MDLNKTNGTQNANVKNAKQQSVKAQKTKSRSAKKAVGGFLAIRKYVAIGLLMAVMIITAVGFSKWNIHIRQTLTVGKSTTAPLLGYVTENTADAILNKYLKFVREDNNPVDTTDYFIYDGNSFAVSVSQPNEQDVAATWDDWGITFTYTYYKKTVDSTTTKYSPTSDSGKTTPTDAGTYTCVVTATAVKKATTEEQDGSSVENDTTVKNRTATSENTTVDNTTAIKKLNFLTNPADKEQPCAAIVEYTIKPKTITVPTANNDYTYNGSEQTFTLSVPDDCKNLITVTNNKQTNAGTYTVSVSLNDKTNYVWNNGTSDDLTFEWTIKPKTLTISVNGPLSITKGESLPEFTSTFDGLVGNDEKSEFTLSYSCGYTTTSEAGDYDVSVKAFGDKVKNYNIIYETTTLTVTAATLKPSFECTTFKTSDVYMEGDVITVTVTVKDKDGNAADLGTLTLTDDGTKNTLTQQGTGTYTLSIYVLYNKGNPYGSNTNVDFTPQISLSFKSTNTDYCDDKYTAEPGSVTVKPVAYNKSTTKYYGTLNKALDSAVSGNNVYLIPGSFITVTEDLTVKSGVTLYVPYTYETYINTDDLSLHGDDPIDTNDENIKQYRKSQILLTSGADLIISSDAKVYLGAITGTKGVYSYYTEITLDTKSHIQVDGSFYCYGYVKELTPVISNTENDDYSNTVNDDDSNTNDSERYIEVSSSGFLEATMALYYLPVGTDNNNNPGSLGGSLQPLNEKNICPVNVFDFPTLQTYTKLISGAQMDALVHMYAVTSIATKAVNQAIAVVRQNTDKTALFYVEDGYLSFEYNTENNYTSISKKTNVFLGGNVTIGSLKIDLSVLTIDTNNYVLPLSYKLCFYALKGSTFTINKKIKLMPGAFIQINEGAAVVISSEVAVHTSSNASYMAFYPSGYSDATFINNGHLTLTSSGKFGGLLSTTQKTQNASCDFDAITSKDSFTVTVYEGNEQTPVTYTAKGEFFDTTTNQAVMAYFVPNTTITSRGDGSRWQGKMNSTSTLIVTKTNSTSICDYEVYLADDQNGTNETQLSSDDKKTFLITNNKWFKVTTYFCTNAEFTLAANNETFESDTWYQVSGNYELSLTGSEAVTLYIRSTSKSGAASVVYEVYCAETENGTYRLMNKITCEGSASLVKDSWYYVDSDKSSFEEGEFKQPTTKEGSEFTCGTKYQIAEYTEIEIGTSSSCLVEGTLITLADGSKKKVEDITANDTLLIFNHETGKYDFAKVLFNDSEPLSDYTVINLKFSNDKMVKVVSEHGFFDLTLNKYVYIDEFNYSDYVGHKFYSATWNGIVYNDTIVTLTNAYLTTEHTRVYSPVTKYHLNYFTEDILSMPGGIEGLFNIFEYGENLKYDEALKQADLELYGELTYADFKDLVSLEMYESYPANYFAVAIGKGILSWDKINYYIERYGPLTEPDNANVSNSVSESDSGGGKDNASSPTAKEAAFLTTAADKNKSSAALPEDP